MPHPTTSIPQCSTRGQYLKNYSVHFSVTWSRILFPSVSTLCFVFFPGALFTSCRLPCLCFSYTFFGEFHQSLQSLTQTIKLFVTSFSVDERVIYQQKDHWIQLQTGVVTPQVAHHTLYLTVSVLWQSYSDNTPRSKHCAGSTAIGKGLIHIVAYVTCIYDCLLSEG